jgi:hypothetical protein
VIYSAMQDTADRNDFSNSSGVITIARGAESAEIRIPLVDDQIREGDETFRLFLSSDPKLIGVADNRVAAVILDND